MTDWATISSLATAGGTLVLAIATFASVRSGHRAARIAEQALLVNTRPLLVQSRVDDPPQKVLWSDEHRARVDGARAMVEVGGDVVYLAISVRNVGSGLALLHGWHVRPDRAFVDMPHADPSEFRRLTIDLYIPAGGAGYWEGAVRDLEDPDRDGLLDAIKAPRAFTIDVLYGDSEGRQRTISRFTLLPIEGTEWYPQVARHWNLDRADPR
jgi:hypothetical protein